MKNKIKFKGKIEKCKFTETKGSKLIAKLQVEDINNSALRGQLILIHAGYWHKFSIGDIIEVTFSLKNLVYYVKHIRKSENPAINYNLQCLHCKKDIDAKGICSDIYNCPGYNFNMVKHFISVLRFEDCKLYYEILQKLKIKSVLDLYAIAQDKVNMPSFSKTSLDIYIDIIKIIKLSKNISDITFFTLINVRYLKEKTIRKLKNIPLIIENIKNYDKRRFSKIIDSEPLNPGVKENLKRFFECDSNLKLAQTILNNREKTNG